MISKFTFLSSSPSLRRLIPSPPPSSTTSPPCAASGRHQTPLFLRPADHSAAASQLVAFRHWAQTLATTSGPLITASDAGPDAPLLLRELRWLLEDATAAAPSSSNSVQLRVSVPELYELWRERIERRRPFQYLVGCEHWRDLVLVVRGGVLIPRPETEMVVDLIREVGGFEEGLWADLGTGSGAIAIGIARMLGENGRVIATDVSSDAVQVARVNVERYGLKDKIDVRQGSWFEPLKDVKNELMGLVSNPPYIPSCDIAGLQAEVGQHEPRLALDGGQDGMDHLLHLCEGSASALKSGGFFAFETNGDKQSEFLVDFMSTKLGNVFHKLRTVADFAGIKRFVTGFRR